MSTKTQKRQTQRYKEKVQANKELLANLTPNQVIQLENYTVYQILYINDMAYNNCKFLKEELKTIPYKSRDVEKIYKALMKRWDAYQEFIQSSSMNLYSLTNLLSEMDEYMDQVNEDVMSAICKVLESYNVPHAHWVARVETALIICEYAVSIARGLISRTSQYSKTIKGMMCLIAHAPMVTMNGLARMVENIHCRNINIDLNNEPSIRKAFKNLDKTFMSAQNFNTAQENADKENIKEGIMTIM